MSRIEALIKKMTFEEKASLCSGEDFWKLKGIKRLGIPTIMVTDGPHGLRKQSQSSDRLGTSENIPATCFPTATLLASSWNTEILAKVGEAIAEECKEEKISVLLGPGANIKRSPLCGRNFEYFSEDPILSGKLASSFISGVQSQGIGTALKHFVANNQEYRRMTINTVIDERTLREIYLAGFEMAVKQSQPLMVMCGYNKVNGRYCSENRVLMTDILKNEWNHEGIVVTDWGAINDRVEGLKAGVELEMPGVTRETDQEIIQAVKDGTIKKEVLNAAVRRILKVILDTSKTMEEEYKYDREAHHALAKEAASEGIVLLKNKDDILPLMKECKVAIVGEFAKIPRYQGSGSSLINPHRIDSPFDQIKSISESNSILYAKGYDTKSDRINMELLNEAINKAQVAEACIVFAGLPEIYESEGFDRQHMKMPENHNFLIGKISEVNDQVIVVLNNGAPVEMPWLNRVSGIIEAYLSGQAGAGAIAEVLYGVINPSGKLAETFPYVLEDSPTDQYFPGSRHVVEYRESIYVGYRYYDTANKEVMFPFGYGLSYTSFEFSDISIDKKEINETDQLKVKCKVENTGDVYGKEVVQLYVRDVESSVHRPLKELKAFKKIGLHPNEVKEVSFILTSRDFSFYNTTTKKWCTETGAFEILIGNSSRTIYLEETLMFHSIDLQEIIMNKDVLKCYYQMEEDFFVPDKAFEYLYEFKLPREKREVKGQYKMTTALEDMKDTFFGRLLYNSLQKKLRYMFEKDENDPMFKMMEKMLSEMPLKNLVMFSKGKISKKSTEALLTILNGKYLKGIYAFIKSFRENQKNKRI